MIWNDFSNLSLNKIMLSKGIALYDLPIIKMGKMEEAWRRGGRHVEFGWC